MKNTEQEILAYAKAQAPHEMCGFLLRDYMDGTPFFYPCQNVADDPENYFEIAPEEQIEAEKLGWIEAIVHSHPNGEATLSLADRQMMSQSDCDWILVCDGKLHTFPKIQPLIGREFVHGKTDCYTLFRDFYFLAGADLPQFEREDDWWKNGQDLYLTNMEANGFKRLKPDETLQIGDVILMQVGADVANHAAIYLGDQIVLHHSPQRLSKRDLYDGYWLKHTHSIWRYKEWSKLDFTVPLNSLARNLS